jgi:tellurium resistance protein TerZ
VAADDDPTSDEEKILINLEKIPPEVDHLVFVISSFSGENFDEVEDAYIQVEDHKTGKTFARFDVYPEDSEIGKTAAIMLRLSRDGAGDAVSSPDQWYLSPIGDLTQGKTIQDLYPEITTHLPQTSDKGGE